MKKKRYYTTSAISSANGAFHLARSDKGPITRGAARNVCLGPPVSLPKLVVIDDFCATGVGSCRVPGANPRTAEDVRKQYEKMVGKEHLTVAYLPPEAGADVVGLAGAVVVGFVGALVVVVAGGGGLAVVLVTGGGGAVPVPPHALTRIFISNRTFAKSETVTHWEPSCRCRLGREFPSRNNELARCSCRK